MVLKLDKRWIVVAVFIFSALIIYLAHWQYFRNKAAGTRFNSEKQLLLTQQIAQNISHHLADRQKDLHILANYALINRFRGRICKKEYQAIRDRLAGDRDIFFIDRSGNFNSISNDSVPNLDPETVQQISKSSAQLFSKAAPDSGLIIIRNKIPLKNKLLLFESVYTPVGQKFDILLEILNLQQELSTIISGRLRSGTHTYILDNEGQLLYHSQHPEMVYRSVLSNDSLCYRCHTNFSAERQILSNDGIGWLEKYDITGTPKLTSFVTMDVLGLEWKLILDTPLAGYELSSRRQFWAFFLLSFLMVAVISGGGYLLSALNTQLKQKEHQNLIQTQQLQHAAAITEAEEKYRTLIEQSPNSILVYKKGKIIFTNSAFSTLFGYSKEEILQGDFDYSSLTTKEDLERLSKGVSELVRREGIISRIPITGITKQKEELELDLIVGRITLQNEPAYNVILRDVTEEKQQARENQRQQNLAAIGTMATRIAHEIKNPLASIQTGIRLVETLLPDDKENKAYFQNLVDEVQRVDQIVKSMLTLARDEKLQKTNFNLSELLNNVLDMVRTTVDDKEIIFRTKFAEHVELFADPSKIEQVIWNLLLNAVEAVGDEGTIEVNVHVEENLKRICITDDGPGIDEMKQEKVFEPFYSTKSHGNGLGLAICNKIVQAHGGHLHVSSPNEKGATICVLFPEEIIG